jgi:hypothetical protein
MQQSARIAHGSSVVYCQYEKKGIRVFTLLLLVVYEDSSARLNNADSRRFD